MAVTFPAQTVALAEDAQNPTIAFTVPTGLTDKLLMYGIVDGVGGANPSGITYLGAALTALTVITNGGLKCNIWYRIAPGDGNNNLIVSGMDDLAHHAVFVLAGAHQTTPIHAEAGATGSGTAISGTVASLANHMTVDCTGQVEEGTALAAGADQTARVNQAVEPRQGMSTEPHVGNPSTMSWTADDGTAWVLKMVNILAAAAAANELIDIKMPQQAVMEIF